MIYNLDPMVILQYINVSIDVIINLKFEDIESKMIQRANETEDEDSKHHMISSLENYRKSRQEVMEENIRTSILDNVEVNSFKSKSKGHIDQSTL